MKAIRILLIALVVYVAIVAGFESLIGFAQPGGTSTLVITTFDPNGTAHERVVSRLDSDGKLYVATNHWPRAWYRRALENPAVQVTVDGAKVDYNAVPVTGPEHDRVDSEHHLGPVIRLLTGFPPRHFLRLDPRAAGAT
jgi:hypothetical protein